MSDNTTTYQDIADYFIALSNETQSLITNLKLQKLVYYVQAWHLAAFDKAVFDDEFQAWVHGPVIPSLYRKYKTSSYNPLIEDKNPSGTLLNSFSSNLKEIVGDVTEEYFPKSAYELERLTHSEDPWIVARGGIADNEPSKAIIAKDSMQTFYKLYLLPNDKV